MKTIAGWLLLLVGLTIMLWGLYSSFNIFTAKTEVTELFKMEEQGEAVSLFNREAITASKASGSKAQKTPARGQDIQSQMEAMMGEQIKEQLNQILPPNFLPTLFNLIAWSIFAGILILGGAQVSGIGIKLLRP